MKKYLLAGALSFVLMSGAQAAQRYAISGIQTASGHATTIQGINKNGWVTGSFSSGGTSEAFLYNGSQVVTLGTLGGAGSGGTTINDMGWIGGGVISNVSADNRPFIYDGNSVLDLSTINPVAAGTAVLSLNNSGQALLYGFYVQQQPFSFVLENYVYNGSTITNTSAFNPGITFSMNNVGGFIGNMTVNNVQTPTIFDGQSLTHLGNFGGNFISAGYGLNDAGWATGTATSAVGPTAFFYDGTTMKNIGSLLTDPAGYDYSIAKAFNLSAGRAINSDGVIVGESVYDGGGIAGYDDVHAFVYENGTMQDLNDLIDPDSGWVLRRAHDVNDAGQIVGVGTFNGEQRGFILTKVDDSVPGETAANPLMPSKEIEGLTFTFSTVIETVGQRVFIDPIVATGYDFTVDGSMFTSALFTSPLLDPDGYELWSADGSKLLGTVMIGEIFTFDTPLAAFRLRGIAPQNMLDPTDENAFVSGFTFSAPGSVTITQTAFTELYPPNAVPEPASWLMMIAGLGLAGAGLRRNAARASLRVRFA